MSNWKNEKKGARLKKKQYVPENRLKKSKNYTNKNWKKKKHWKKNKRKDIKQKKIKVLNEK